MSRLSEKKSNSTRLPPRRVAPAKKRQGKQSKALRRKMVERENAERERLNGEIVGCTVKLFEVLAKGGVPERCIDGLRKDLSFREDADGTNEEGKPHVDDMINSLVKANSAVDMSWSFATCYPSININALISTLDDLRSLMADSANLNHKPVQRKLEDLSSDPKADPAALEVAKKIDAQWGVIVTKCLVGAYKTRALRLVGQDSDTATQALIDRDGDD